MIHLPTTRRRPSRSLLIAACTLVVGAAIAVAAGGVPNEADALTRRAVEVDEARPVVGLSPPRTVSEVDPGDSVSRQLRISNRTPDDVDLVIETVDLSAARGIGSTVRRDPGSSRGAAAWLKSEVPKVSVKSGEQVVFDVQVAVPKDAAPGAWAAGVSVTETLTAPAGQSRIEPRASLGSQFLFEVSGAAAASATLSGLDAPRIVWHGTKPRLSGIVTNTGDTLIDGAGEVEIDSFLNTAAQQLETGDVVVLPEGRRRVSVRWNEVPWLGWFHPKLTVTDEDDVSVSKTYPTMFVLPPWWLIALLVAFLLLPFIVRRALERRVVDGGEYDEAT